MSSWDDIPPNLNSTTLRRRACGHPCGHFQPRGRARAQRCWETQRTLFPMALPSSAGSVNVSQAQKSVPPMDAATLCKHQSFYNCKLFQLSWVIGSRKIWNWNKVRQVQARSSLIVLRFFSFNEIGSPLLSAMQSNFWVKWNKSFITSWLRKKALVWTVGLQALEARTLKSEKKSFKNLLADQDAGCKTFKKREMSISIFSGLHLQQVGVDSRVLKSVFASWACKTSELYCSDSSRKQCWIHKGENGSADGIII